MYFFKKIKPRGVGVDVEYGGVRVQGMCPHEFYLGTCTCIFKKIKPRGVGVDVEYGGVRVQGMCPHECPSLCQRLRKQSIASAYMLRIFTPSLQRP